MTDSSHLYIIYQGHQGKFNWRKVDANGETMRDEAGAPISSNIAQPFEGQDDARANLLAFDPEAQIELRPVANFDETIDEAEEREEREAGNE